MARRPRAAVPHEPPRCDERRLRERYRHDREGAHTYIVYRGGSLYPLAGQYARTSHVVPNSLLPNRGRQVARVDRDRAPLFANFPVPEKDHSFKSDCP